MAAITAVLLVGGVILWQYPRWLVGTTVFLTTAALPLGVPIYLTVAGFNIYYSEIAAALLMTYALLHLPARRTTDTCGAIIVATTGVYALVGISNQYTMKTVTECRSLFILGISMVIAGRVAGTVIQSAAIRSLAITLWLSLITSVLATYGGLKLVGRSDDASLLAEGAAPTGVIRLLTPATQMAVAVVAISLGLWALRPSLFRSTLIYFIPGLLIGVLAFSRNSLLVLAITLAVAPILNRSIRGLGRAALIFGGGLALYFLTGSLLASLQDIRPVGEIRRIYEAYVGRVVGGIFGNSITTDKSLLYRHIETDYMLRAVPGHELFGHGFGYSYKPPRSRAEATTAHYGHNYYLWTLVKTGYVGLAAYLTALFGPLVSLLRAPTNVFCATVGAAAFSFMITSWVVPFPIGMTTAPVLGALIGSAVGLKNGMLPEVLASPRLKPHLAFVAG